MVWVGELEGLNLLKGFCLGWAIERRFTNEELIGEDTDSPDIDPMIVCLSFKHFRRQVVRSAANCLAMVIWAVAAPPKVRNLDCSVAIQQVFWLQIPVHHVLRVEVFEWLNNLPHIVSTFRFREPSILWALQLLIKLATHCKFENEVNFLFIPEVAIKSEYILMS